MQPENLKRPLDDDAARYVLIAHRLLRPNSNRDELSLNAF
jgi:hypothetical protein